MLEWQRVKVNTTHNANKSTTAMCFALDVVIIITLHAAYFLQYFHRCCRDLNDERSFGTTIMNSEHAAHYVTLLNPKI